MSLKKNSIMFQKHFKIFVGEKFDIHWTFREYKFGLKVTLGLHSGHINLITAPKISDLTIFRTETKKVNINTKIEF